MDNTHDQRALTDPVPRLSDLEKNRDSHVKARSAALKQARIRKKAIRGRYCQEQRLLRLRCKDDLESLLELRFHGRIICQDHGLALWYADTLCTDGRVAPPEDLVIWTDGSLAWHTGETACAAAVIQPNPQFEHERWTELAWAVHGFKSIDPVELLAVSEAVKVASKIGEIFKIRRVIVMTDSQAALKFISQNIAYSRAALDLLLDIYKSSRALYRANIELEINWVPGHQCLGNIRADELAGVFRKAVSQSDGMKIHKPDSVKIRPLQSMKHLIADLAPKPNVAPRLDVVFIEACKPVIPS